MFSKNIHIRIKIVLLGIIFLFIVIMFKVFYIQVISYKKLNSLAASLWNRNLPVEADRGKIYDRNGVVLADNKTTTSLVLIPNQIKNKELVAQKLSEILNVTYDEMYAHVNKKSSIERVHPEGLRPQRRADEEAYSQSAGFGCRGSLQHSRRTDCAGRQWTRYRGYRQERKWRLHKDERQRRCHYGRRRLHEQRLAHRSLLPRSC